MKKDDTTKRLEEALHEANAEEREDLRAMWHLSDKADEFPDIGIEKIDALWQKLEANAASKTTTAAPTTLRKDRKAARRQGRGIRYRIWTASAIAALLVAFGITFWLQPIVTTAPFGEQLAVHLPDGSTVELNSGSTVKYPRFFAGNRNISLEGEAYFDVVESAVPFTVQTFNAQVQVLGTTFNVKAWRDGSQPESQVTLTSGSIRLTGIHNDGQEKIMVPGETMVVRQGMNGFIAAESDSNDHLLAWRKGELVFKDQQLALVLEDIERRFGINIDLIANSLANKEVTFAYRQITSTESVIEDLCHALDLKYRPIANGYELFEE